MLDLIKMNIYRSVHMKSFYILPFIMAFICFLTVALTYALTSNTDASAEPDTAVSEEFEDVYDEMDQMPDGEYGDAEELPAYEENEDSMGQSDDEDNTLVGFLDDIIAGGFITMILGIGAAFIVSADYKNGFIKNYAGQVNPKGIGAVAKIPAVMLELIVMLAAVVIALYVCGCMFIYGFSVGSAGSLFKILGMQILLCTAFGSVIMFFAVLTRSSTLGIVISIYLSSGFPRTIINILNSLLYKYMNVPESFDLGAYTIERYTTSVISNSPAKHIGYAAAAAAVYLVISAAASFMIGKKRDI